MIRQRTNIAADRAGPERRTQETACRAPTSFARAWLIDRMREGDPAAIELAADLMPDSKALKKTIRDEQLRNITRWLLKIYPPKTEHPTPAKTKRRLAMNKHRAAIILTYVQARVIRGRSANTSLPADGPAGIFSVAERRELADRLEFILWLDEWPRMRQLQKIIDPEFALLGH